MTTDNWNAAPPRKRSELWSLREDVNVELESGDGLVRLHSRWGQVIIERPSPSVREALRRMRLGPIVLENVTSAQERPASDPGTDGEAVQARQTQLERVLDRLQPLIIRSLRLESGQPLLSVVPLTARSRFRPVPLAPDVPVRLSTFAELRTDGNEYLLESPLALHRVVLHRVEAIWLMACLARPVTPATVATALPLADPVAADALEYLAAAGMLAGARAPRENPPVFAEDTDPALAGWSPADLMFHIRSTLGRHDQNFGITYPAGETVAPEPVVKAQASQYLQLHRPRWPDLYQADPPLTVAIEGRRSVRRYAAAAMTAAELGELLYRTARVRSMMTPAAGGHEHADAGDAPTAGGELSDRPYPSGGACYELELYVTVGNCAGLPAGVYHYDPLGHRLEPVSSDPGTVHELLSGARVAAAMDDLPPVLITMTARFRRLSWKYEGLAYRLVLMHVGVLIQNLYLVCTAMRLAPCALGSVSIDTAARAFGTDWRIEPCVGQFIVGREPGDYNGDIGRRWNVNDAEWADLARASRR
jgi:SagB-type dehydrogenase family enzyme